MNESDAANEDWVIVEGSPPSLAQEITVRSHHQRADEPCLLWWERTPDQRPYHFLLTALGS